MNNTEIIERMKKEANIKEDQELAKIFGLTKSAIANWKRGSSISLNQMMLFAEKYDCDLNWLITGKERKQELELDEMEQLLLNNYKRLDSSQKLQLLNASLNGVGSGVNQVANGENNKQQLITGNVGEVTGIKK